ncbi:MAG: PorT family protein [Paludibacter sp.]|nr:PorT family protein [Paludibacter sp.]
MKHCVIIILLLASFTAAAQHKYYPPELYVGASFGYTISRVGFNPKVKQTYLLGNNGGLMFRYIATKNLGWQVELNFQQRGWNERDSATNNNFYARRLDYVEIPFMTHFNFGTKFRLYFNIGPKFSYLLNEKELTNNTNNSTLEQHYKPVYNRFDYGFCGGPGFYLIIKKQVFQIDGRFNYSVADIFSNDLLNRFNYSNNLNISLSAAWLINLK